MVITKDLFSLSCDYIMTCHYMERYFPEKRVRYISLHDKIDSLTVNLDKMYMDRLTGLLAEADFERIYQRVKMECSSLEEKVKELEVQKENRSVTKNERES